MKIGRNDLCHCGSGKKFKKCCINNAEKDVARQSIFSVKQKSEKCVQHNKDNLIQATKQLNVLTDDSIKTIESFCPSKSACKKGCSACCHIKVDVSASELFLIQENVVSNFSHEEIQKLKNRIEIAYEQIRNKEERPAIPCPLLNENGDCSIYIDRPIACRSCSSTNSTHCKEEILEDADPEPSGNMLHLQIGCLIQLGAKKSHKEIGVDYRTFELIEGLKTVLSDETLLKKWENGYMLPCGGITEPDYLISNVDLNEGLLIELEDSVKIANSLAE